MRTRDRAHAVGIARRATWWVLIPACLLVFPSLTCADDAKPPAEPVCFKQCAALGFDDGYCERACTVPPSRAFPPTHSIDWDCATHCRAANADMGGCVQACKRN